MPTARPRVLVTETDDLAAALEAAARAWPEETSRARLLTRLALIGSEQLDEREAGARTARRRRFLSQDRDRYRGLFPPDYLERLREEWPR